MAESEPAAVPTWGTCRFCGDAAPPGAARCPTCGSDQVVPGDSPSRALPSRDRRRLLAHRSLRMVAIGIGALALAYFVGGAALNGPPSYPDPLTGTWTHTIPAGQVVTLSGSITGEDYVAGNFSVLTPPGAQVVFAVYNNSEFATLAGSPHGASPVQPPVSGSDGRIVFAAPYTDTYYLVWKNPYPVTSGIAVTIYVTTDYRTNIVLS